MAVRALPALGSQLAALGPQWWGAGTLAHCAPGTGIQPPHRETAAEIALRVADIRATIQGRGPVGTLIAQHPRVVLVGHSCIFHDLVGEWLDNCVPHEVQHCR